MHPNECVGGELKRIRRELYAAPSTNDNLRKIKAIESQIKRHEAEAASDSKENKPEQC